MSTLAIILVVAAILVIGLLVVATLAVRRRSERAQPEYARHLAEADHALEAARASDRGWEFSALELVLVDDRPGVTEDRAHFEASDDGSQRVLVVLTRHETGWSAGEVR